MAKFFVSPETIVGKCIRLTGDDASHISRVLRMKVGEEIIVCDSQGTDYRTIISAISDHDVEVDILDSYLSENEPALEITLFQGLPKGDKMELIIQKCVELGVSRIVPMATEFAVAKISDSKSEIKKLTRWNKVSEEAAKQSGRGRLPNVTNMMSIAEAIELSRGMDMAFVPYEKSSEIDAKGLSQLLKRDGQKPSKIGFFIGPEGGFSKKEIAQFIENSITPVSLGKRILRTETAGMAVLALLMYEFGYMD